MQLVEDIEHPTSIVDINDKMSVETMEVDLHKIPDLLSKKSDDISSENEIFSNHIGDKNHEKPLDDINHMDAEGDLNNKTLNELNDIELAETINNVIDNLDKELNETESDDGRLIDKVNNTEEHMDSDNDEKHSGVSDITKTTENGSNNGNLDEINNSKNDCKEIEEESNVELDKKTDVEHSNPINNKDLEHSTNKQDEDLDKEDKIKVNEILHNEFVDEVDVEANETIHDNGPSKIDTMSGNDEKESNEMNGSKLSKSINNDEELNELKDTDISKTTNNDIVKDIEVVHNADECLDSPNIPTLEKVSSDFITELDCKEHDNITPLLVNGVLENEKTDDITNTNTNTSQTDINNENITTSKSNTTNIIDEPCKETEIKSSQINVKEKTLSPKPDATSKISDEVAVSNLTNNSEMEVEESIEILEMENNIKKDLMESVNTISKSDTENNVNADEVEIMDIDEIEKSKSKEIKKIEKNDIETVEKKVTKSCLVNSLDIISDDEDEIMKDIEEVSKTCIDLDEDDDIMFIDDDGSGNVDIAPAKSPAEHEDEGQDTVNKEQKTTPTEECISIDEEDVVSVVEKEDSEKDTPDTVTDVDDQTKTLIEVAEKVEKEIAGTKDEILVPTESEGDKDEDTKIVNTSSEPKSVDETTSKSESGEAEEPLKKPKDDYLKEEIVTLPVSKPIFPPQFVTSFKSKITEMSRDELEEFCLLKIVEGITDRINFGEIKTKLKNMTQHVEEWRKKAMMLLKQTRDLQVVLEKVQDEYNQSKSGHITPMRITRSVGMQVFMSVTKSQIRNKKPILPSNKLPKIAQKNKPSPQSNVVSSQSIPVPKLVPVNTAPVKPTKSPAQQTINNNIKNTPNGVKTTPNNKPDKRPFNSSQSVTVDLTDDEPPAKQAAIVRNQNVRLVSPQQLMNTRPQFSPQGNSPRKVFIPISGQQGQNIRPGQTIMFKSMQPLPRTRAPNTTIRMSTPSNRNPRLTRHPAPLPDASKQPQPPNWKALPPSPDLKISKVDNGIVISWKIEGYQEDSYEEIASYQLYAYQETSSPPSTSLWKKIGDVKALPLPMACTLTQFMAGYKYFFAVRAVDVRSRIGPFSLPGSILLLNK